MVHISGVWKAKMESEAGEEEDVRTCYTAV
jgi:hypothetical protein